MLAVYLFIILLTYTGNDPSWSHISSDMTTINNMGGAMGAWLSDLLYSFFGFGAWWWLAFLVYESILIWWDNKPTFWLLRLVAYVFLLLSASALFAQLVALIQHVSDPVATGLTGVAGGIIGLELQARLAQLLSTWGSVVFLTVFVIITVTFAFNIHWLPLYHKLTNLAWLGSGVKSEETEPNSAQEANSTQQPTNKRLPASGNKDVISNKEKQQKKDYEQLPLELQSANGSNGNQVADNSKRFSHALTDFLAKSGLGASVKASMAAQVSPTNTVMGESLQAPIPSSNNDTAKANHTQHVPPNSATTPVHKIEPSFAWNDAGTVNHLLATTSTNDQNATTTNTTIPAPAEMQPAPHTTDYKDHSIQQTQDGMNVAETPTPVSNVDELAATWLAEPAIAVASDNTNDTPLTSVNKAADHNSDSKLNVQRSVSDPVEKEKQTPVPQNSTAQATDMQAAKNKVSEQVTSASDMTPTNTPSANPTIAPKAAPTEATAAPNTVSETVAVSKSTMNFAIPEGDSSNHIADMMPDDYRSSDVGLNAPVMPDIHDDAAFSQRSRSMQTAEYRARLSPIPEISILDKPDPNRQPSYTDAELGQLSELLEIKLQEFNVKAQVVNAIPGPVVTRFEVELAAGIKASKVTGISRDLARSLSMASLRVVEVIPGKPYIGIEVPNKKREMVRLIELLNTEKFKDSNAQISMAMGKDIGGKPIITDLARAPHMLVAGTTGSGKSVLVNAMLLSMLLKYTPNELRLILIDPKQLELANYNDIPHLLTPVVTDMTEAASSLSWCVAEMERRYQLMSLLKVRKLNEFNKKVRAAEQAGKPMLDPLWRPNDNVSISQAPKLKTLPMIVIVADEFADMIMQVGKQAEELITRLAQKSRAAGIHLILATQRPSVDVITGLIKANIPVRAALRVNSKVDSRTILDSGGAEDMLGNGDMLFLGPGQIEPDRVHGAYVSDEEVNSVCDAWRERGAPNYIDNMAGNFELSSPGSGSTGSPSGEDDDLYNDAVGFIMETRKVSASSIQRKFSIGYNRAARIVDSMEEAGLVSSMGKSGKRELLM